ncbi:MAG: phosphoglycerate kinase [Rhodospirillaceae bacterium]|nr:phosphoglycerate kinase [Rhodospirillaceae bacterium]
MPAFKTLDQAQVAGQRVLVRADLNVPAKDGRVTDATRIERFAPTVKALVAKGAKVVVLSHFDRPKGKRVAAMSLKPVVQPLADAVGAPVTFAEDCIGEVAASAVHRLAPGGVLLLENLRFHPGEEANDPAFVKALAALGDVYVNDAFSAAHRAHASTEGLAHALPAFAGLQMQAELEALSAALETPQRPVMAIVGGAKVSTKIELLNNLIEKVDVLAIGGAMANTFLFAQGVGVGKSLHEPDLAETAREIMTRALAANCAIVLPHDAVIADALARNAPTEICAIDAVPADQLILDIGPASAAALIERMGACKTLLWNGPVGAFETPPFDQGTMIVARAAAKLVRDGKLAAIAGGGDTVAALNAAGVADDLTYVSTAGGAFLEFIEGKTLPGVAALSG